MYFPYFRGKQYELVAIRETAELMAKSKFVPIIEPVKESLRGLERALTAVEEVNGQAIVVLNPEYGDLVGRGKEIRECIKAFKSVGVGYIAGVDSSIDDLVNDCKASLESRSVTIVHAGFDDGRTLAEKLGDDMSKIRHVFLEKNCGKLYRRHFKGAERVLIRDGFERRTNRDYPSREVFSDLHVTFEEEGMGGFGDFLIVGDQYSESGGPAYAIAIHLTTIDEDKDQQMVVFHFVSDRVDTPKDPAGKFLEALSKLVGEVKSAGSPVVRTEAVEEFLRLHEKGHFPGLGYIKKLSMKHHLETLSGFFSE